MKPVFMKERSLNPIMFGLVTAVYHLRNEPEKSYGFLKAEDGQEYYFQLRFCRKLASGVHGVFFMDDSWDSSRSVCAGVGVVFQPDKRPARDGEKPRVYRWALRKYYDACLSRVQPRPLSSELVTGTNGHELIELDEELKALARQTGGRNRGAKTRRDPSWNAHMDGVRRLG